MWCNSLQMLSLSILWLKRWNSISLWIFSLCIYNNIKYGCFEARLLHFDSIYRQQPPLIPRLSFVLYRSQFYYRLKCINFGLLFLLLQSAAEFFVYIVDDSMFVWICAFELLSLCISLSLSLSSIKHIVIFIYFSLSQFNRRKQHQMRCWKENWYCICVASSRTNENITTLLNTQIISSQLCSKFVVLFCFCFSSNSQAKQKAHTANHFWYRYRYIYIFSVVMEKRFHAECRCMYWICM